MRVKHLVALACLLSLSGCFDAAPAFAADKPCKPPTGIEIELQRVGALWSVYEGSRANALISLLSAGSNNPEALPVNADLIYVVKNPDAMDTTLLVVFFNGCMVGGLVAPTDVIKQASWQSADL